MKLTEYIANLNQLIADDPRAADMEVVVVHYDEDYNMSFTEAEAPELSDYRPSKEWYVSIT